MEGGGAAAPLARTLMQLHAVAPEASAVNIVTDGRSDAVPFRRSYYSQSRKCFVFVTSCVWHWLWFSAGPHAATEDILVYDNFYVKIIHDVTNDLTTLLAIPTLKPRPLRTK